MKRITALLGIAMMAMGATAATNYGINVGGVEVTSSNAGNITGGDIEFRENGYASYNASTNTLTLNSVYISRTGSNDRAVHNRSCDNLKIVLSGFCHFIGYGCSTFKLDRSTTIDSQGYTVQEIDCYSSGDDAIYLTSGGSSNTKLTITGKTSIKLKSSQGEGIAGSKKETVVLSNANLTIEAARGAFCDLETVRLNAQDNVTLTNRGISHSSMVTLMPTSSSSYAHARNVNYLYTQTGVEVRTPSGTFISSLKTASYYNQKFIISDESNSSSYYAVGNFLFESSGELIGPTVSFKYSSPTKIEVPGYVNIGGSYKNVSIGMQAFYGMETPTSATLHYGVRSIRQSAFRNCSKLSVFYIPSSVINIGDYAFYDTSINTVYWATLNPSKGSVSSSCRNTSNTIRMYFPTIAAQNDATSIITNQFTVGTSKYSYDFAVSNSHYVVTSEAASGSSGKMALVSNENSIIDISGSTASFTHSATYSMGNNATYHCTSVAPKAFYGNTSVTSANLASDYLESIDISAFENASYLKKLSTGRNLKQIGSNAFTGTALETVEWNTVSYPDVSSKSASPFYSVKSKVKTLTIGSSVTRLPSYLFADFSYVTVLEIPYSLLSIGDYALTGIGVSNLIIPNQVTTIGPGAFAACNNLSSVTIGTSVTALSEVAFTSCAHIKTVYWQATNHPDFSAAPFNSSASSINSVTFGTYVSRVPALLCYNFSALRSVTLPTSIKTIGIQAFAGSGLTALNTNYVSIIAKEAFASCGNLSSLTLGSALTELGNNVFSYCSSLQSVILPSSLSSMGTSVFRDCTSLATVTDKTNLSYIPANTYQNCSALKNVKVRDGVTQVGRWAFMNSGLTTLEIPESVNDIGEMAFGCPHLARIDSYPRSEDVTLGTSVFYNVNKQTCQLHVRPSCLAKYKVADQWKDFYNKVGDLDDPGYNPYDVNGDGAVDVGDVNAVLEAILNNDKSAIYDVNGDSNVDVGDVNAVLEYILSNG